MHREGALLAEFATTDAIAYAARTLHAAGYVRMEAYTPHPLPELDSILGIPRSRTPRVVLAAGVTGALFAFLLQYWLNGSNYPLNVGSRPLLSAPAFIPITFETTILFASFAAFAAWLAVSRLPTLDDPLLAIQGFSSSLDRFWLAVTVARDAVRAAPGSAPEGTRAKEPSFDAQHCIDHLRSAGALRIVLLPEVEA